MIRSFLPTIFRILLLLSVFSVSSWAQNAVPSKPRTATQKRTVRPTSRARAIPSPALNAPVVVVVVAAPVAAPKTALSRSTRVFTGSTAKIPQRISTSAQPEDAYQRELQDRMVNWHPVEISFQLLTSMSWNSASGSGSAAFTDNFGSGLRTSIGPNIDVYFFRDRYAFGTGLWYTIKRIGYSHPPDRITSPGALIRTSAFNLQYLQVPLTMKLMSNTLFRTGRAYVQYGGTMDFKLAETAIEYQNNYLRQRDGNIDQFTSAGLSLLLAVGYMHRLKSRTNDLIMTMQYQRSLTNNAIPDNLWAISQHFAVGVGLSF